MSERDMERASADLALIRKMVDQSRTVRAETGHIYVFIGVLFVVAAIVDAAVGMRAPQLSWIGWPVAGIGAGLYSAIEGRRLAERRGHVGYAPPVEGMAWIATTLVLSVQVTLNIFVAGQPPQLLFPTIAVTLAIPLSVSSVLYRNAPLAAAAVIFVLVGVATAFVGAPWQQLGFAVAMIAGYIVPGILTIREHRAAT